MSRREEREQRKRQKQVKSADDKLKLLNSLGFGPKVQGTLPNNNEVPKVAPHLLRQIEAESKKPKAIEGSRFGELVTWCVTKKDIDGTWEWGEPRAWTDAEWQEVISPKFQEFQKMTWQQVDSFGSDSGHKMHHGHDLEDLVKEAQQRWLDLGLEEFDDIFRFRLGNERRAWGYILQAHFFMVWWERKHCIYEIADD